jgi:hypothetical protein
MPDSDTYDVWVINDPDGPVLYFPVASTSAAPPGDHVALHRRHAARTGAPEGLIEGVWTRARQRLAAPSARLVAEIADPEVETRRAAQRAATMARASDAAAWAPEELLAEPEPDRTPRSSPRRTGGGSNSGARPARPRSAAGTARPRPAQPRATKPRATKPRSATPSEPEEKVCPSCFMMRRTDQFTDDGTCEFCQ